VVNYIWNDLVCPICEKGILSYSPKKTMESYLDSSVFVLDDIENIKDAIISDFITFECVECEAEVRYTYRSIDKIVRKTLSKLIIDNYTKEAIYGGNIPFDKIDRVFVYCGKCSGFDGNGSCLLSSFEKCKLKRLPNGL